MESLGFSLYSIVSSVNEGSSTSFFPISVPFNSSSCLIVVARTSSAMLNKSSERGHHCFVPDLKKNVFSYKAIIKT